MLLDHSKKQNNLKPAPQVKVADEVDRSSIVPNKKSVTRVRTLRVDNHISNKTKAIIDLGLAKDNKDIINRLLNAYIDNLDSAVKKRLESLVETYEEKDYITEQAKQRAKEV